MIDPILKYQADNKIEKYSTAHREYMKHLRDEKIEKIEDPILKYQIDNKIEKYEKAHREYMKLFRDGLLNGDK